MKSQIQRLSVHFELCNCTDPTAFHAKVYALFVADWHRGTLAGIRAE